MALLARSISASVLVALFWARPFPVCGWSMGMHHGAGSISLTGARLLWLFDLRTHVEVLFTRVSTPRGLYSLDLYGLGFQFRSLRWCHPVAFVAFGLSVCFSPLHPQHQGWELCRAIYDRLDRPQHLFGWAFARLAVLERVVFLRGGVHLRLPDTCC